MVSDRGSVLVFSVLVVVSSVLLIVAVLATIWYYRGKVQTISYGLAALRGHADGREKAEGIK